MGNIKIEDFETMPIYIEGGEEASTLQELFLMFYKHNSKDLMAGHCLESYYDELCMEIQCNANKLRSLEDMISLATTYFPKITLKEILHCLVTLPLHDSKGARFFITIRSCSDINKINMYYFNSIPDQYFNSYKFGNWNKLNSPYSWDEIFKDVLGVNLDELMTYIKNNYLNGK